MALPKILVFCGSIRTGSINVKVAALAAKELALAGADVTYLSLADYPLPIYDGDLEAKSGPPENAVKLKQIMQLHAGVFIVSPEYNASVTPLLKNTIDWISRVRGAREQPLAVFKDRAFALGSASNGQYGGMRSLLALRQVLSVGCGALVLPDQISVSKAVDAFDEAGALREPAAMARMKAVVARLIEMAHRLS